MTTSVARTFLATIRVVARLVVIGLSFIRLAGPALYTLLEQPQNQRMTIRRTPDAGVRAYSFTVD